MSDYIDGVPLDDRRAFNLISQGLTYGLFQIESFLAKKWCKKIKPKNIDELCDIMALIRPGALKQADTYVAVKNGEMEVTYLDDRLKPILESTAGIILYQEQSISIAQILGGFSESRADELRAAIGKKNKAKMDNLLPDFVDGCVANKMERITAQTIADIIVDSASYQFNLSHSKSYAFNCYLTAYYKANYTTHFFLANLLTSKHKPDQMEEIKNIYYDMKNFGMKLLPPSLKNNSPEFKIIDEKTIEFGLNYIKGCGIKSFDKLKKISNMESWGIMIKGIVDNNISKAHYEPVIKCGALDYFNISRAKMLAECELVKGLSKTQLTVFKTLFKHDLYDESGTEYLCSIVKNIPIANGRLKLSSDTLEFVENLLTKPMTDHVLTKDIYERNLLGINMTSTRIDSSLSSEMSHDCMSAGEQDSGGVQVIGLLENVNIIKTKNDDKMAFIEISDLTGKIGNIVIFPDLFNKAHYADNLLKRPEEEVLIIKGYKKEGSLICKSIEEA